MRFLLVIALVFVSQPSWADETATLVIKDHKFVPANLEVPAGQKIKITVDNQDSAPEEVESQELHVEKIIPGNSKGVIFIRPLKPGVYKYFGEFNPASAQGTITAK